MVPFVSIEFILHHFGIRAWGKLLRRLGKALEKLGESFQLLKRIGFCDRLRKEPTSVAKRLN